MTLIRYQTICQIEVNTDTGRQRLISGWTKLLGEGNGAKKVKVVKELDTGDIEEEVIL